MSEGQRHRTGKERQKNGVFNRVLACARWLAVPLAAIPLFGAFPLDLEAKKPGARHCYRQVCVRVRSIQETEKLVGQTLTITTSHYGDPRTDRFNTGRYTSNGERFSADDGSRTASADFPDGTELLLRNPENGRVSHVRVNDFGPFMGSRRLDVTQQVARDLDFFHRGVVDLEVTILAAPTSDDRVYLYRRNRQSPETGGFMGRFSEVEVAGLAHELIENSRLKSAARESEVLAFVSSIVPPRRKPDSKTQLVVAELHADVNKPIRSLVEDAIVANSVGGLAQPEVQTTDKPQGPASSTADESTVALSEPDRSTVGEEPKLVVAAPAAVPETLAALPAVLTPTSDDLPAATGQPIFINATSADVLFARSRVLQSPSIDGQREVITAQDVDAGPFLALPASATVSPKPNQSKAVVDREATYDAGARAPERQMALALVAEREVGSIASVGALQSTSRSSVRYAGQPRDSGRPNQLQFLALLAAIFAATVSIYAFGNIALRARASGSSQLRVHDGKAIYTQPPRDRRHFNSSSHATLLSRLKSVVVAVGWRKPVGKTKHNELWDDNRSLTGRAYRGSSLTVQTPAAGAVQSLVVVEPSPVVEAPKLLPSAAHETVIGEGITIESDIASDEAVYITGEVIGNVSGRRVELAAGAVVKGHIAADHAIIDGSLTGNIDARELSVLRHGVMSGNARIEVLSVEPGARVDVAFTFLRPEKVA